MQPNIYYKLNGQEQGPITSDQLRQLLQNPHFRSNALVKLSGTTTWRKAASIKPKKAKEPETVPEVLSTAPEISNDDYDSITVPDIPDAGEEEYGFVEPDSDAVNDEELEEYPERIQVASNTNVVPQKEIESSKDRYPLLFTCMSIIKVFTIAVSILTIFSFFVMAGLGLWSWVFSDEPVIRNTGFNSMITAFLGFLSSLFTFISIMALLEFIKVLIDIEYNTRKVAEAS